MNFGAYRSNAVKDLFKTGNKLRFQLLNPSTFGYVRARNRLEAIPWATNCLRCQKQTALRESLSNGFFQDLEGDREYGAA